MEQAPYAEHDGGGKTGPYTDNQPLLDVRHIARRVFMSIGIGCAMISWKNFSPSSIVLVADVYKLASRVFASVTNHFVAFAAFDAASDTVAVYETARARGTTVVIPPASVVSHRQMRSCP